MKHRSDLISRTGRKRRSYSQLPHTMIVALPVGPVPDVCRRAHTPPRPRTKAMRQAMAIAVVLALLPLGLVKKPIQAAISPAKTGPIVFASRPPPAPLVGGVMLSFASSMR